METDYSVLIFFFLEANVKVYYRAGKGWSDVLSILVTEKCIILCFLTLDLEQ